MGMNALCLVVSWQKQMKKFFRGKHPSLEPIDSQKWKSLKYEPTIKKKKHKKTPNTEENQLWSVTMSWNNKDREFQDYRY